MILLLLCQLQLCGHTGILNDLISPRNCGLDKTATLTIQRPREVTVSLSKPGSCQAHRQTKTNGGKSMNKSYKRIQINENQWFVMKGEGVEHHKSIQNLASKAGPQAGLHRRLNWWCVSLP